MTSKYEASIIEMGRDITHIRTVLEGNLPEIKNHLKELNGRVESDHIRIALVEGIHERCPIASKKFVESENPDEDSVLGKIINGWEKLSSTGALSFVCMGLILILLKFLGVI